MVLPTLNPMLQIQHCLPNMPQGWPTILVLLVTGGMQRLVRRCWIPTIHGALRETDSDTAVQANHLICIGNLHQENVFFPVWPWHQKP